MSLSVKVCFISSENSPLHLTMTRFLVVLMMEGLHTLGITMLCFMVLPHLDSVDALLLTSSLAFVPALFLFLSRFQVSSFKRFSDLLTIYSKLGQENQLSLNN